MFMGSVLVAKEGKPVFNRGYGMADLETEKLGSGLMRFLRFSLLVGKRRELSY